MMCLLGEGTEKSILSAIDYFKKSSELGNVYSMNLLIKLYSENKDFDIDIKDVIEKLTAAANLGNGFAQYILGSFYMFDETARDIETAKHWLNQSAEQGNTYAQKLIDYINNPEYQLTPAMAALNLFRGINRMIASDYQKQQNRYDIADKKLMKKIIQKKEALGQKHTLE